MTIITPNTNTLGLSGATCLMTIHDPTRPEKELISDLKDKLECIMNQWASSPLVISIIGGIQNQLRDLGLSEKEISEIE